MSDLISRQAAIEELERMVKMHEHDRFGGELFHWTGVKAMLDLLPSEQPERLTDDDFETIRIHLSAHKEQLCNQLRWKEAEEYQRIIDRFMAFASAQPEVMYYPQVDGITPSVIVQPEIIRCKDCKHFEYDHPYIIQGIPVLGHEVCNAWGDGCKTDENGYCFMAERRTDETD